jgi:ABC-type cobalamin/Fe3+-siderophores transport system ATPase subunit
LVETATAEHEDYWEPIPGSLVSARAIELHGPWGHVFGPLDLDIDEGGVTVLAAQSGAARTALLMALCGRMRLSGGSLTVLGHTNKPAKVFAESAIACVNEIDDVSPSVTVRDMVTEQLRWQSPWFKFVPRVHEDGVERMCAEVFGEVPLPALNAFVDDLPEIQQLLLRIAVANTRRPPLLVVGRMDKIADDEERLGVLERLVALGEKQSVITADVNPLPPDTGVRAVVDLHGLLGAGDVGVMTEGR